MFSVLAQHIQRVGYNNWGICDRDSRVSHPVPCTPGWDVILSSGQRPPIMHAAQRRLEWWRGVSRASGGVRPSSQHKLGVHDKVKTTRSGKQNRPLEPLRVRAVHTLQWYSCENMFVTPNSFVSFSCALQMMNLRRWEKGLARSWRYLYTCLLDSRREKNVRTNSAEQHLMNQNRKTLHSTSYNDVASFLMLFDPKVCPQTHVVNQCFELYSRMRQGWWKPN